MATQVVNINSHSPMPEHIIKRVRFKNGNLASLNAAVNRAHAHSLTFGNVDNPKLTAIARAFRQARFVGVGKKADGPKLKGKALIDYADRVLYNNGKSGS